jgi:lipid II:glycine glycyltransferase (peptidoglycan interpeptide bridge formation enzyme)
MQAVFKSELDNSERESIIKFCNSVDYCSIEQSLGWTELFYKSRIKYFYLLNESEIKSFCQISERLGSAEIVFGPVCCDRDVMVISIEEIIKHYKKRGFYYLGIQLYYKSGFDTEYIEYALNKHHKIKYLFNAENTKTSIELDLQDSIEDISGRIRKGHKSDIKKAVKLGVTVDKVQNINELYSFSDIYSKMCRVRKIDEGSFTKQNIDAVYKFLVDNRKGEILIAKDNSGEILGGVILVYQGNSVRFFRGTSDPDRRDIPMLHLVLYEAIKRAKSDNFKYFDFWGYNHFVDENDQVFNINHFKKGFGGYYTFFAKKMNINLVPFGTSIFKSLLLLKRIVKKIV